MAKITAKQYDEMQEAYDMDDQQFVEKLEEYTGITRKPYIAYNYFDCHGNYIGCSEDSDLDRLLENAYVEVDDSCPYGERLQE